MWMFSGYTVQYIPFHCVVCPSLIYVFWLLLLWFTPSDYSFFDLRLLITPSLIYVFWLLLLWFTPSDYSFFDLRLLITPSLIYVFWLLLWYVQSFLIKCVVLTPSYRCHLLITKSNMPCMMEVWCVQGMWHSPIMRYLFMFWSQGDLFIWLFPRTIGRQIARGYTV